MCRRGEVGWAFGKDAGVVLVNDVHGGGGRGVGLVKVRVGVSVRV